MSNAKDLLHLRELHQAGLLSSDEYVAALRKLTGQKVKRQRAPVRVESLAAPSHEPLRSGASDLPLLFALAALAFVAAVAALYFVFAG